MKSKIKYKEIRWRFVLTEEYEHELTFMSLPVTISKPYYKISRNKLLVSNDYAWDGLSGPTVDTKNSRTASLVHDVLYQAIREGVLPYMYRKEADKEFRLILKNNGMFFLRYWYFWAGVRLGGGKHARKRSIS